MEKPPEAKTFVILGDDQYLVDSEIETVKKRIGADQPGAFEIEQYRPNDRNLSEILENIYASSFFARNRLVVVRNLDAYPSREREAFLQAIGAQAPNAHVIMTSSEEVKTFPQARVTDLRRKRKEPDLRGLVRSWEKRENISFDEDVVDFLATEYKDDPAMLNTELEKIRGYFSESRNITLNGLRQLAFHLKEIQLYDLSRAVKNREKISAIEILAMLRDYVDNPSQVIWWLSNSFYYMLRDKAFSKPSNEISYGQDDWKSSEIIDAMKQLYLIDRKIKSGTRFPYVQVENFVFDQ